MMDHIQTLHRQHITAENEENVDVAGPCPEQIAKWPMEEIFDVGFP